MRKTRILLLILAVVLIASLSGCGKTIIEAYDSTPPIDFEAAYAQYEPDTVLLTIEGEPVTWQELFYEVVYSARLVEEAEGVELRSWDQVCTILTDTEGNYLTYGEIALQNAVSLLSQYHVIHAKLTAAGAILGKDALDAVDAARQQIIDENFGGDEQAFLDYLDQMYCSNALWLWFNQVDALYQYNGFDTLYGKLGCEYPDESVYAYASGDPDGNWTEYVQIKQIYIYNDSTGSEDTIMTALGNASGEPEAVFDSLYAEYNGNADLDAYASGRAIYAGDTDDAIYQAALAMGDYEYALVPIDGANVIVMRVPLSPDAGVYYDVSTGTMYTLRYYAAWQDYYNQINGADGWLANADVKWLEGFENFALTDPTGTE